MKRRVASLPPITADTFTEKVLQARAESTAEADKAYFERACDICDKTYYSQNAYENHLLSQKHKANQASAGPRPSDDATSLISSTFSLGEPIAVQRDSVDSDAEDEFNQVIKGIKGLNSKDNPAQQRPSPVKRPSNPQPVSEPNGGDASADASSTNRDSNSTTPVQNAADPSWTVESCIFCNYKSPSTPLNAHHMERFHGMFIPEKTYLADLDGLVEQLQRKVHEYHQCLFCDKVKSNAFAIQTHMRDKGHCKIPYDTEVDQLEIGDFYDFRSTYSDDDETPDSDTEEEDQGGAKLGARRVAKVTGENGEELKGEEDGWETDSSESSLDSADLTAVPAEGHYHQFERLSKHPHHASGERRNHHQVDGWHSHAHKHNHAVFYDEYELHLPSGKSVGHRSLNKYYRQNLNNYPTPEERAERQAIEASEERHLSDDDEDPNRAVMTTNGRGRKIIPRGAGGMIGISDQTKANVRKEEKRSRKAEMVNTKKTDWAYSRKLNNHKNYYYREQGGG